MSLKNSSNKYFLGLITGMLIMLLSLKIVPLLSDSVSQSNIHIPFFPYPTPTLTTEQFQDKIEKDVLPDKVNLDVSFGDTIARMVNQGAIDKQKFLDLYKNQNQLSKEEELLLSSASDEKIIVTKENAGLLLNLLWPLGLSNQTSVLSEGPMGKVSDTEIGNYASTGGWTLGQKEGGKLFNSLNLINLNPKQESLVTEIAQNIYRPCCGNSTYFPDCNHGAAMLGFIELAVSQGLPKEEIYHQALALNSYWFPQTYVENGIYFRLKKGISWDKVDPKEVLGQNYSSGQGYLAINKELESEGLLPKVESGGSCGV